MIYLIGNDGSFSFCLVSFLTERAVEVEFCSTDNLLESEMFMDFMLKLESGAITCVVYLGGEVSDTSRMHVHNYKFPRQVFNICSNLDIKFIWLSSLSIYENCVSVNERRLPKTEYGRTKFNLEEYIESSPFGNYVCLRPASIVRGRGRSSLERAMMWATNSWIARLLRFPGVLSYCFSDDIYHAVYQSIVDQGKAGCFNISRYLSIEEIQLSRGVGWISLPLIDYRRLRFFRAVLPFRFFYLMKQILCAVKYE